jgi:hypothetical protein
VITHPRSLVFAVALLVCVTAPRVSAGTFTVTNTTNADVGSLRWAILQANAVTGPHRITFNIPGTGVHVIQPLTPLPGIVNKTAIDATTQPGYVSFPSIAGTPLIELDGSMVPGLADGILILNTGNGSSDGSSIRGLSIGSFDRFGVYVGAAACTLVANHIGCDASGTVALQNQAGVFFINGDGVVGGPNAKSRNVISGNSGSGVGSEGFDNLKIQGNYIGTNAAGTAALPNWDGITLNLATRATIGGLNAGERNLISGNAVNGIWLTTASEPGTGHTVVGNWIGTNVYGTGSLPNQAHGIVLDASYTTIGDPAAPNVISGNGLDGINGGGSFNVIQDNFVGTTFDGTRPLGNLGHGISLDGNSNQLLRNVIGSNGGSGLYILAGSAADNVIRGNAIGTNHGGMTHLSNGDAGIRNAGADNNFIGGPLPTDGNLIAYNPFGIRLLFGIGNSLRRNRIHSNVTLDIDLELDGVTANDANDIDEGPNNLQNFPVLSSVTYTSNTLQVTGQLLTNPLKQVVVDIFSSPTCHASGYGGGDTWLGSVMGVTDATGLYAFQFQSPGLFNFAGHQFTATATALEPDGVHASTSELSPCEELAGPVVTVEPSSERAFAFAAPHPQPARGALRIPFALARPSRVALNAYDVAGRLAAVLLDELRDAGPHEIVFDTHSLAPGVYRLRLEASATDGSGERYTKTRGLVVVR